MLSTLLGQRKKKSRPIEVDIIGTGKFSGRLVA